MAEQFRPDLVEVHKVLLKMIKAVTALCDQYNIQYSFGEKSFIFHLLPLLLFKKITEGFKEAIPWCSL